MKPLYKSFSFNVTQYKAAGNKENPIGIVTGYASTFGNIDRGGDIVAPGAFDDTILEHRTRGNRPIRLYANHDSRELLGGIPIESVRVDEKGLWIEAHLDLNVAKAKEFYSLAQNGFLTDFSIGYGILEDSYDRETDIRTLLKLRLFEISLVNEPMNMNATVDGVKTVKHKLLPLAARTRKWDTQAAETRVKEWAESAEGNSEKSAYLPGGILVADVIDGKLFAVPNAIIASARVVRKSEGHEATGLVEDYYSEMGLDSPFDGKSLFRKEDVEIVESIGDVSSMLKDAGFSNSAANALLAKVKEFSGARNDSPSGGDGRNDSSSQNPALSNSEPPKQLIDSLEGLKSMFNEGDSDGG